MGSRRIGFFLFWLLDIWALLYTGKSLFYYVFFIFAVILVMSVLHLILSYFSFSLRTNRSVITAEKNQPFVWKLLPKARNLPVAHARISVTLPDITHKRKPTADYYTSPGFRDTVPVSVEITSPYCGTFPLLVSGIEFSDIFGLWKIKVPPSRYLSQNPVYVSVLPDTSLFLQSELLYDDIVLPVRKTRERAEAVGVREYGRGDSMRSIHWKYSARMGKLHVKEYEIGAKELHLIYLDLTDCRLTGEDAAAAKDYLLCSAASLCRILLKEQVPMTILGYSDTGNGRFSLTNAAQWQGARGYLSRCRFYPDIPSQYKETIANYILSEKSTLTIFSMAVTPGPLSFLTYRAGDYSSVSLCFIPQSGYETEQQRLVHLFADKGIHATLLAPAAPAAQAVPAAAAAPHNTAVPPPDVQARKGAAV